MSWLNTIKNLFGRRISTKIEDIKSWVATKKGNLIYTTIEFKDSRTVNLAFNEKGEIVEFEGSSDLGNLINNNKEDVFKMITHSVRW